MRKEPRKRLVPQQEPDQHRINEKISAKEIRLVMESEEPKVMSTYDAIKLAEEQEMDLVEISPNAVPPVCKIMDYRKFLYNQKRKQKELKAKQSKVIIKEIRFGPNTDEHDFQFKLVHAKNGLIHSDLAQGIGKIEIGKLGFDSSASYSINNSGSNIPKIRFSLFRFVFSNGTR
jgi:translation initiation factor IF-3